MKRSNLLFSMFIIFVMLTSLAVADVPQLISYQGRLTDAGGAAVPDAAYLVKFIIYNDPVATGGGAEKWSSGFQTVNTIDGLFNYDLGSITVLPDDLFTDTLSWLGITVGVDPELLPRTRLTSKGYAYHALRADSAGTAALLDGQSPSFYIAWSNMTGVPSGFADGIDDTTNSLEWSALTSVPAGFADGTDNDAGGDITNVNAGSGLTGGGSSGSVTLNVGTGLITSSHIAGNTITAADIAASGVGISEIAANAVGASEIVSGAIFDIDVNSAANIATTKISGTAVNLSSTQTITGHKQFGDSTAIINNNGITIGTTTSPPFNYLVFASRTYNTTSTRYGQQIALGNLSTGVMYGLRASLGSINDAGGTRYGVYSTVDNLLTSTSPQYAVFAVAGSSSKSAGTSYGVRAYGYAGSGSTAYGIYASEIGSGANFAGFFSGNVHVSGTLSKSGGAFRIDHPLDPSNMYLQHSFVESPDMMNIYNGNIVTDGSGYATVTMPDWFKALNMDFRYQLTVIGEFAQAIIGNKMNGNQFSILTDKPNIEVSWQVTGIRNDKYAQVHRIQVEVDKPAHELGTYLNPEEHGQPIERHANWEQIQEERKHDADEGALNDDIR